MVASLTVAEFYSNDKMASLVQLLSGDGDCMGSDEELGMQLSSVVVARVVMGNWECKLSSVVIAWVVMENWGCCCICSQDTCPHCLP